MKFAVAFGCAAAALLIWLGCRFFASPSAVEAEMTSNVLVKGVSRFGINLGGWQFWGADQFSSNMLKNPGFEGLVDGAIVIPAHTGSGAFDDSPGWLARLDAFWEGAHFSIRTGPHAGMKGTVVHSSRSNFWGLPSFVARDGDPIPNPGDVVALVKDSETDLPTQWWFSKDPSNSFMPEQRQPRPGSPGTRSLRVRAGSSAPATVASYFDTIGERAGKLLPLSGEWNLSFWARLDKGNAGLHVSFGRQGALPLLSRDIAVSGSWQNVKIDFPGYDDGPPGAASLVFQITGLPMGEVLLDDVDLRRTEDADQPFRHEVYSLLSQLHPAYLRDWEGQLADTLANRTAGPFARKSYRYRPGDDSQTDYGYGLQDFLDLCVQLKASPWIVVPPVFDDEDCSGLGGFLASRRDLDSLPEILVEFGNENWNPLFRPGGIPDPQAHGQAAGRCFSAIRGHAAGLRLKTVVNAQADYPAGAVQFARQSAVSDIVAVAPYFFRSLASGLPLAERISVLRRPNQDDLNKIAAAVAPLNKDLAVYEVNLHTVDGTATAGERLPAVAGIESGSALAKTMLDSLALGARRQCAYSLTGFESRLTSQPGYVPLWGMARDVGPTQRFRPTGLALELLNEALRGDMVSVRTHGPKDVSIYAFKSPDGSSAVFISASAVTRQVDFGWPGAASLRLHRLISDAPGSTNEDSECIRIRRDIIPAAGGKTSFDLPPGSIAVLLPAN
jgi:hypothetical protein